MLDSNKSIVPFFFVVTKDFFFLIESFNLWCPLLINSLLSDQDINQFRCRWRLNLKFLIQPWETLLIELIRTDKKKKVILNSHVYVLYNTIYMIYTYVSYNLWALTIYSYNMKFFIRIYHTILTTILMHIFLTYMCKNII